MSDFSLKAVINRQKNKVLFAEMENDLANVLVGFMALPLGRIVRLLRDHYGDQTPVIGSLSTLYNGVANLDCSHFKSDNEKKLLLGQQSANSSPFEGNFFEYAASFIVSGDLCMTPSLNQSLFESLHDVGILFMADMDGAETRILTFGLNQIMDLLKGLFISSDPLNDVILGTNGVDSTPRTRESGSLHDLIIENIATPRGPKEVICLNLIFERSTKKLLFAQAGQDFVDILISLLVIPLGAAEHLFPFGITNLGGIGSLYSSISDMPWDFCKKGLLFGYINPHEAQSSLLTNQSVRKPVFVDSRSRMYLISDDLTVTPFSVCSTLSRLNHMKISVSRVKQLQLHLRVKECTFIMRATLTSAHAMTDGLINIMLRRLDKKDNRLTDAVGSPN